MERALIFLMTALLLTLQCSGAHAQSIKEIVSELNVVPVEYGTNSLQVNQQKILLIKGRFENGNAWSHDVYNVLVNEGNSWQYARTKDENLDGILISDQPHTQEDAVVSVTFLLSHQAGGKALYLLKTQRKYKESPVESAPTEFTLYRMHQDDDFGVFYFSEIKKEMAKTSYYNSDEAAYQELNICNSQQGC